MLEGVKFCPNCGAAVVIETAASTPVVSGRRALKARPLGVTILVILETLVSLFTLVGGAALMAVAAILAAGGPGVIPEQDLQRTLRDIPWASGFTGVRLVALTTTFLAALGAIILVLAILGFVMAWGLWTGKRWARIITMVLSTLSIVTGLFSLPGNIVSILINATLIYYLTRPVVIDYYR
ncbi:DUF2127 domain-containing protein [Candidatus Bathyarchaeota archaeon]|nr:DUF2127 domain-containing protein [Candidatus Bathyarchaeota archaeon]